MLFSSLSSVAERLDSKFITAYFFPAFVAVMGSIWILASGFGAERLAVRLEELDSVEQAILVGIVLLVTMMMAHMLSALARPIGTFYAGRVLPGRVREWSIRGQLKARLRNRATTIESGREDRLYPSNPAETEATAFGNVLAATIDYPRVVYAIETFQWWPRLMPLLPSEYQNLLSTKETPMRAMLNLSLVFAYLAFLGVVVLGLAGSQALNALLVLVVGLMLSQLCYRLAVTQATELARAIWVAFDLYRSSILEQLHEEIPANLDEERALWKRLTERYHVLADAANAADIAESATAVAAATALRAAKEAA